MPKKWRPPAHHLLKSENGTTCGDVLCKLQAYNQMDIFRLLQTITLDTTAAKPATKK